MNTYEEHNIVENHVCHHPCEDCKSSGYLDNGEICPACAGIGCKDKNLCVPSGGMGCDTE